VTDLNLFVSGGMISLCEPPGALHLTNARVIPNGIDIDYYQPRKKDAALAAQLGVADTDFVIGSNAGLGTHKRVDLMLRAVAELPGRKHIKIVLLGEKRAAADYLHRASLLGLEGNIICDGMFDDVRPYLSLFDLGFVLSDSIETSSYAAKEMMAMGVPLICTRFSGLPENVDEKKNGFLIEPGDLPGLTSCVAAFMGLSAGEKERFRLHSRDKVEKEFSQPLQMKAMAQAYGEICR
jgi:glycosyltransferase involved in cell wall biosynthesis